MEMKWFMGFIAFLTFLSISHAASNIPKWYNSNGYRIRDYELSPSSPISRQQWLNFMRRSHQWKNNVFLRYAKNDDLPKRTCGRFLNIRVVAICGGCPPHGLAALTKRSSLNTDRVSDACCIHQCTDEGIRSIACSQCEK